MRVEPLIAESGISTVNLSEVLQKGATAGANVLGVTEDLQALGLEIIDFTIEDARICAQLWEQTSPLGLSLGDRACLATGVRLQATIITADRAWSAIQDLPAPVRLIR